MSKMRRSLAASFVCLVTSSVLAQDLEAHQWGNADAAALGERASVILARDPQSSAGWTLAGQAYLQDYLRPSAVKCFERSFASRPNQEAAVHLSSTLLQERQTKKAADWALKAMDFPTLSLTSLALYETATSVQTSTIPRVQELRAHKRRWESLLEKRAQGLAAVRFAPGKKTQLPPDGQRTFTLSGEQIVAASREGAVLWKHDVGESPSKLVATGPRVFAITEQQVVVLDAGSGNVLATWPSEVALLGHRTDGGQDSVWSAWQHPEAIVGADRSTFWLNGSSWMSMLRQSDAGGWARYNTTELTMFAGGGTKLILVGHRSLEARDAANGKLLWEFDPKGNVALRLLQVKRTEVVLTSPQLGKLLALSRATGQVTWSQSHRDILHWTPQTTRPNLV